MNIEVNLKSKENINIELSEEQVKRLNEGEFVILKVGSKMYHELANKINSNIRNQIAEKFNVNFGKVIVNYSNMRSNNPTEYFVRIMK